MQIYFWEPVATTYIVTTLVSLMTVEMFLICHVTAREQMFKGLRETMGGSP